MLVTRVVLYPAMLLFIFWILLIPVSPIGRPRGIGGGLARASENAAMQGMECAE